MQKLYQPNKIDRTSYNAQKVLLTWIMSSIRHMAERLPSSMYAKKYDELAEALEKLEEKEIID
jgi:hypothetical protein